ncbi:YncE family protein [Sandarakinorhabdus limnophila]|uniref:Vgb family protein n=1 Tax=Sandarakinorhabdus limnophila TaxID=210512 RepID=UPI003CC7E835
MPYLRLAVLIPAAFALLAAAPVEQIIPVPGFADFLTIDGNSVWVTNKGRVERWSRRGKLATVSMRHPCGTMALTADALWVADCDDKTLSRIDRRTARIITVIATGIAAADGEMNVVAGAGSVWLASAASGLISRIDPSLGRVNARITVAPGSNYLAFGHGALWAVSGSKNLIQKIDPATNRVIGQTRLGRQPGFLVAGEGAVWVQEQADGTVARVDPARVTVSGRIKVDTSLNYGDIDTGGGKIWLRTTARQSLVVIDATTLAIRARLGAVTGSGAVRYTPRGVWTSAHDRQSLSWWPDPARLSP